MQALRAMSWVEEMTSKAAEKQGCFLWAEGGAWVTGLES